MTKPAHQIPARERRDRRARRPRSTRRSALLDRLDGRPASTRSGSSCSPPRGRGRSSWYAPGAGACSSISSCTTSRRRSRARSRGGADRAELLTVHTAGGYEMLRRRAGGGRGGRDEAARRHRADQPGRGRSAGRRGGADHPGDRYRAAGAHRRSTQGARASSARRTRSQAAHGAAPGLLIVVPGHPPARPARARRTGTRSGWPPPARQSRAARTTWSWAAGARRRPTRRRVRGLVSRGRRGGDRALGSSRGPLGELAHRLAVAAFSARRRVRSPAQAG